MSGSPFVSERIREKLSKRTIEYHNQLAGTEAEIYLKERGFTQETIQRFRLGYVATPMKGDQMHHGRLVIPYHTRNGVVALRSRSIPRSDGSDSPTKYLPWTIGDVTRPFNTTALDVAPEVILTEGEMDAMIATQLGYKAIGIPGVQGWKEVYKPMFRYRQVTILADMDDHEGQGMKFARLVAKELGNTSIVPMPSGHDVNSAYLEYGAEYLRKMIEGEGDEEE